MIGVGIALQLPGLKLDDCGGGSGGRDVTPGHLDSVFDASCNAYPYWHIPE